MIIDIEKEKKEETPSNIEYSCPNSITVTTPTGSYVFSWVNISNGTYSSNSTSNTYYMGY